MPPSLANIGNLNPNTTLWIFKGISVPSGLQIIFKLANIHLTPETPEYGGGSWHVEGALNEHICATALYYYDQQNITESHIAFRQSVDTEEMETSREQVIKFVSPSETAQKNSG